MFEVSKCPAAVEVGTDHALLDLATNDVVNQTVRAQHITRGPRFNA